jgi:branched-chain amino acid transport system substrate-binding protein
MKKRNLLLGLMVLLVVVAMMAMACGSDETTTTAAPTETTAAPTDTTAAPTETTAAPTETTAPAATGEPIKIGHICDLTGVEATTGENMKKSLEMAFDAIGWQINGRPIELITEDGQDSGSVAVDRARKLVEQDKVVAIFGPTEITEKFAVAGYIKEAGVPLILYSPSPPPILEDNKWVVGVGGTTLQMPSCMGDYVFNTLGYKTVNTIAQEGAGGESFIKPFVGVFEALGGKVVGQQWAPSPTPDFAAFLTALDPADAVVAWQPGGDGIKLHIQYHKMGIDMPMVGAFHGAFYDPWVFKAIAPDNPDVAAAMAGEPCPIEYSPDSTSAANQKFLELAKAAWGPIALDGSNSNAYSSAQLFIAALTANGAITTPDELLTALLTTPFEGAEGPVSFQPGPWQAATRNVYIVEETAAPEGSIFPYQYKTVKTYEAVPPTGFAVK